MNDVTDVNDCTAPNQPTSARPARAAFDGAATDIRAARRFAISWMEEAVVDPELQQRVTLAVSELAANAVEAAPEATFQLALAGSSTCVEVGLTSAGDAAQLPPFPWDAPAENATRGRGLAIVSSVASNVRVVPGDGVFTIVATVTAANPA